VLWASWPRLQGWLGKTKGNQGKRDRKSEGHEAAVAQDVVRMKYIEERYRAAGNSNADEEVPMVAMEDPDPDVRAVANEDHIHYRFC